MACYTVFSPGNQIVYSGEAPPIDMSYQIHEKLPAVFPSGHLIFDMSTNCPSVDVRRAVPQLTNVALVTAAPASRRERQMTRAQRERALDSLTK